MNESGPIKRPIKTYEKGQDFYDLSRIRANIWKASRDGKFWMLKTAKDNDAASLILLRREYELSCNLNHPFIASSFVFLEESPVGPAIMMEYIEGRSLREVLAENPALQLRHKILNQILDAVEYLHRKELLHNDIKPENIMVSDIGNDVKIIDFGFAENDSDFLNRRLGGTVGASAPEVLSGSLDTTSGASSDIYAIGGILQLMFPHKYRNIIKRCHRENPKRRYPDIASLRRALAARNRSPYLATASVAIILAIATLWLPGYLQDRKIAKIRSEITYLYQDALNSIENNCFTYRDEAIPVRDTFFFRYMEYKKQFDFQIQFSCDTIYSRLITDLTGIINELPWQHQE